MLATYWYPSTSLIGPGSVWPAVGVALYALLVWRTRWRWILMAAPVLFLALTVSSEAFPFPFARRFPNADDYLGYYILLAATAISATELARRGTLLSLLFALPFLFIAGWLLILELVARLLGLMGPFGLFSWKVPALVTTAIWFPVLVVESWRVAQPYRRVRRARAGRCIDCGYDLRASPHRCPECGRAVEASA